MYLYLLSLAGINNSVYYSNLFSFTKSNQWGFWSTILIPKSPAKTSLNCTKLIKSRKKETLNFLYIVLSNKVFFFPVHQLSCKLVFYFLSFDLDRLPDLGKGMVVGSYSSPISSCKRSFPFLKFCTEVENSSYNNHLYSNNPWKEVGHGFSFFFHY